MKAVSILQFHQSSKPFIISVKTDNAGTSNNDQFTIPTTGSGYNYNIKTNDGHDLTGQTGNVTLTFSSVGTYNIEISGDFPRIYFNNTGDRLKLLEIKQWGSIKWSSMYRAFYGCANMQGSFIDIPNFDIVTNTSYMFAGCSVFNWDIGDFDMSNVTDASYMMSNCYVFNKPIGGWDVSNIENLGALFWNCYAFNQYIGDWDVSNANNMALILFKCYDFNQDISGWNVGKVKSFYGALAFCYDFNQNIGGWNVGSAENMREMLFNASSFDQNIGNWDVRNVTNFTSFLQGVTLSTTNYDALLTGWYALPSLKLNCNFHGGNSKYTSTGETAKNSIISSYSWAFTDGGLA